MEMPPKRSHAGRRFLAALVLGLLLAGCAVAPPQPGDAYGPPGRRPYPPQPDAMRVFLNVITTPLFLVFKGAVCAVTTAIAVPATAITAMSDPDGHDWQRRHITEGFAANCGPPYVLF